MHVTDRVIRRRIAINRDYTVIAPAEVFRAAARKPMVVGKRNGRVYRRIGPKCHDRTEQEGETSSYSPQHRWSGLWPLTKMPTIHAVTFLGKIGGLHRRAATDSEIEDPFPSDGAETGSPEASPPRSAMAMASPA